jgi:hypothetical protein
MPSDLKRIRPSKWLVSDINKKNKVSDAVKTYVKKRVDAAEESKRVVLGY